MDAIWEQLCIGYVNDTLSPMQRKQVEQRIASGDPDILEVLENLTGFPREKIKKVATDNRVREETTDRDNLKNYVEPSVGDKIGSDKKELTKEQTSEPSFEQKTSPRTGQWITRIAALLAIVAILGLAYSQWMLQLAESRIITLKQREQSSLEIQKNLKKRVQKLSLENDRIKSTLPSDFSFLVPVNARNLNGFFKKAYVLMDLSTQRSLAMIRLDSLPAKTQLTFWIQNKYRDWNLFGSIDEYKTDSLYLNWRGDALTHGRVLEVHANPVSMEEPTYESGERLGRVQLP